jgi:hypothetical protein
VTDSFAQFAYALAGSLGAPIPRAVRHRPYLCPACGSTDLEPAPPADAEPALAPHYWRCHGCENQWLAPAVLHP